MNPLCCPVQRIQAFCIFTFGIRTYSSLFENTVRCEQTERMWETVSVAYPIYSFSSEDLEEC